jgi:hypothetical protein
VTKLNASGTALLYSTYLGGSGSNNMGDAGVGIAVDSAGNAYVTGATSSSDFPTTAGAFQTTLKSSHFGNAFVTKLNASGTALVYSTYLGGGGADTSEGIAVDGSGNAYVAGNTWLSDFPTTVGAFQTTPGISNVFVTKLNASGTGLIYSSRFGGNLRDACYGLAVDAAGNAYVTGFTGSANFPTTPGAFQTTLGVADNAFVTKLNASGTALVYSTFLGGIGPDTGFGIAVDGFGNAYITGDTGSTDFPTTPGALQTTLRGGKKCIRSQTEQHRHDVALRDLPRRQRW